MKYFDIYFITSNEERMFLERTENICEARYRIEYYLKFITDKKYLRLYLVDGLKKTELEI